MGMSMRLGNVSMVDWQHEAPSDGFDWAGDVAVVAGGSVEPSTLLEPDSSLFPHTMDCCGRVREC